MHSRRTQKERVTYKSVCADHVGDESRVEEGRCLALASQVLLFLFDDLNVHKESRRIRGHCVTSRCQAVAHSIRMREERETERHM